MNSDPLHVLFITGPFPRLTFIFRMVVGLAEMGHNVRVAARNRGTWHHFEDALPLPQNLSIHYLPPDSNLAAPRRLLLAVVNLLAIVVRSPRQVYRWWQIISDRSLPDEPAWRLAIRYLPFLRFPPPDIIQFEFLVTATQYPLLKELLNVPVVVSCRGADLHMLEQRSDRQRSLRIQALQEASAIHCVSQELADEVTRLTGRTHQIFVNRPAVPVAQIPAWTGNHEPDTPPVIITVGRLAWKKGYDYFLASLARLKEEGRVFTARIIGSGTLYPQIRFSIEDLGLTTHVQLLGQIAPNEVFAYLQTADIFVLSSHEEGIANAALEAMAVGLPVVTTTAGGMSEVIRDGVDGYIVPVRDIGALTERIDDLLQDRDKRREMGRAAHAHCVKSFDLARQIRTFSSIYAQTVSEN